MTKRARAFEKMGRLGRFAASCLMGIVLAVSFAPRASFADEVSDAQSALDAAEARMKDITAEYDKINSELSDIQQEIDATASEALAAQKAVFDGRRSLGDAARNEYRSPSVESILALVLESGSFDELTRNVVYVESILQAQADEVAAQKKRVATLDQITRDLNSQKDTQERALRELDETKQQAQEVVSQASSALQGAKDAEAARLEALKSQADSMSAAQTAGEEVSDKANTTTREEVVSDATPVAPNPDPDPPSSDTSPADNDGGWKTGVASAYGGATDPYTPNPGITATGDVCDDESMGVAVPMSWPDYRSYLGKTVQISYNGMTVYAVINDCGYMGAGSRSLDLQPGVWKAFGYSSCTDWGLRTVSYRIL